MSQAELSQALTDVRRAYRLIWAWQRRALDLIRDTVEEIECDLPGLAFREWVPTDQDGRLLRHTDPSFGRWAWAFIPMVRASYRWSTSRRPERKGLYVELRLHSDSGFSPGQSGEPSANDLPPAESCRTTLWPVVLAIPDIPPAGFETWPSLLEAAEQCTPWSARTGRFSGWDDADAHMLELKGGRLGYGGLEVDLAQLHSEDAVRERLTQPLRRLVGDLKGLG